MSKRCEVITTKGVRCRRNGTRRILDCTWNVRWTWKEHDDPHQQFPTDATTPTMGEQQADYDTDDMHPTPGTWRADYFHNLLLVDALQADTTKLIAEVSQGRDQAEVNARLIAAAGNAASELPGWYDPVEAIRALPQIIQAAEKMESADVTGQIEAALRTARGDANE